MSKELCGEVWQSAKRDRTDGGVPRTQAATVGKERRGGGLQAAQRTETRVPKSQLIRILSLPLCSPVLKPNLHLKKNEIDLFFK